MRVSVIIPTANRPEALCRCLNRLAVELRALGPGAEAIVVDDGSGPEAAGRVEAVVRRHRGEGVERIRHETNLGVSAARNTGTSRAAGDLLVFLDDDLLPEPGFLRGFLQAHRSHPDALLVCGHLFTRANTRYGRFWANGYNQVFGRYDNGGEIYPVPTLSGGNLSVKRCVLDRIRPLFDPGLTSREDMDLFLRARDAGLAVYQTRLSRCELEPRRTWAEFVRQRRWYAKGEVALRAKHGEPKVLAAERECRIELTVEMKFMSLAYRAQQEIRSRFAGGAS